MWKPASALMATIAALALLGCTPLRESGGDDGTPGAGEEVAAGTVAVPAERLSPFCQAMQRLDEELADAPDDAAGDLIIAAYRAAIDDVPAAIATEFAAVLDALEHGTVATLPPTLPTAAVATTPTPTTAGSTPATGTIDVGVAPITEDTHVDEGYLPDDSPVARVNEYIEFVCRGTQNNPGPPATQPGGPPTTGAAG